MGINFCRGNALMPQHSLYDPQVRAPLQQMGSKRMAESMGTYRLLDSGCNCQFFDPIKIVIRDKAVPLLKLKNTKSSCPGLIRIRFLQRNQFSNSCTARPEMGTKRSFSPLPFTLMKPSSKTNRKSEARITHLPASHNCKASPEWHGSVVPPVDSNQCPRS